MDHFTFTENGTLEITPTALSSQHDFDFYVGKWEIRNKKLKSRLSNCTEWLEFTAIQEMQIILDGKGNTDNFITTIDGTPFEGRSLRLFNPQTKLWSMYWTDTISCALQSPTVGSFDGNIGRFYDLDTFNGQEILVQFHWDKTDPNHPIWSQAFSTDKGKTWEWNWYMYSSRIG